MVQTFMDSLKPEEKLLVLFSKLSRSSDDDVVIKSIVPTLDDHQWLRFFDNAVKHKILNIVIRNAKQMGLSLYTKQWNKVFTTNMHANEIRNKGIYEEIFPILYEMEQAGIEYAALKGLHLNHVVYKDIAMRQSNDIDLLVKESGLTLVTELLTSKGFIQSKDSETLQSASTKLKRFYRLSSHELVPFLKRTDKPFCPVINIDIQFDIIGRSKNTRIPLPYEEVFNQVSRVKTPFGDQGFYTLSPEFALLQLCAHLFRDMTRIQDILSSRDLKLINFLDIYQFIECQNIDWEHLLVFCVTQNVNHIIYYALYHIGLIYPCSIPEWFLMKIAPEDLRYLNQYGFEEGTAFEWHTPFHVRMFGYKHKQEVEKMNPDVFAESKKFADGLAAFS